MLTLITEVQEINMDMFHFFKENRISDTLNNTIPPFYRCSNNIVASNFDNRTQYLHVMNWSNKTKGGLNLGCAKLVLIIIKRKKSVILNNKNSLTNVKHYFNSIHLY